MLKSREHNYTAEQTILKGSISVCVCVVTHTNSHKLTQTHAHISQDIRPSSFQVKSVGTLVVMYKQTSQPANQLISQPGLQPVQPVHNPVSSFNSRVFHIT